MFHKLYPGEEFLPRAPEPEEIIMDGYEGEEGQDAVEPNIPDEEKKSEKQTVGPTIQTNPEEKEGPDQIS